MHGCRIPAERQAALRAARSSAEMTGLRADPLSSERYHARANPQCAQLREDADVIGRPDLPPFSPLAQPVASPATAAL